MIELFFKNQFPSLEQLDEEGYWNLLPSSANLSKKDLSFNVWDINSSLYPLYYTSKGPRYKYSENLDYGNVESYVL